MPTEAELQAAREAGYLTPTGQQLIRHGDDAISTNAATAHGQRWYRGFAPSGLNAATASPGTYYVSTYATSGSIVPTIPGQYRGGGQLEIGPGTAFKVIEWSPVGTSITPKPVLRNEYNSGLGGWQGWHLISPEAQVEQRRDQIAVWGDSHSDPAVVGSWDEAAQPLILESLENVARSGDSSNEQLISRGVIRPRFTVTGGQIPASGAVTLTTDWHHLVIRADRLIVAGYLGGVAGSLRHIADGEFRFTRASAGDAVPVSAPVEFVSAYTTAAATVLVWFGGNDFTYGHIGHERSIAAHLVANYQRADRFLAANGQVALVAGVTNRLDAGPGTEGFAQVQEVNATLAEMFPGRFLDVQGYYSQHALSDMGVTPNPEDEAAMAGGAIPPALFIDNVHVSAAAHAAIGAHYIAPWLVAAGYATPAGPMELPATVARTSREERLTRLEAQVIA